MPRYRYRALTPAGEMVAGVMEAPSSDAVRPELEKSAFLPIDISEEAPPSFKPFARRPRAEEITGLTEELAMLLDAGMALDRALRVLAEGARPVVGRLLLDLRRRIAGGESLARAVAAHPRHFPRTYGKMVEAAELSGTLAATLRVIARERRRAGDLRRRIASALVYPAFLVAAAAGVLVFVLTAVVPEFERALAGFTFPGRGEPMVFALSRFLRAHTELIALAAILLLSGVLVAARSPAARGQLLRLAGGVPGLRRLFADEQAVWFSATLATLTRSGVDLSAALRLIRDLLRDPRAGERMDTVVARVRQGRRLTEALLETDLMPRYAVHMLRVGEETGALDAAAERVAGFYEAKLDRGLARLTGILAPAVIVAVSLLVAWLIISIISALLSVNELLL